MFSIYPNFDGQQAELNQTFDRRQAETEDVHRAQYDSLFEQYQAAAQEVTSIFTLSINNVVTG